MATQSNEHKTLPGGMTGNDSTLSHLDDGTLTIDSKPCILFDQIPEGRKEDVEFNAECVESFDLPLMHITGSPCNVVRIPVESHTDFRLERNGFRDNLDSNMFGRDGSTPSEHNTRSQATALCDSDHEMYLMVLKILSSELVELNESESIAGLSQDQKEVHSLEQSLPSYRSSVGFTPLLSGPSEMEIDDSEEDSEIEMHQEEFGNERSLLLVHAMMWAEHGDDSLLHEIRKELKLNIDEASSSQSHGQEGTHEPENLHPINWTFEKDCIGERMLGEQTASMLTATSPLHEELLCIVQEYENFWKNLVWTSGQRGGRILRRFQTRITLVANQYCVQHYRDVTNLPDFCIDAFRQWVQIDAHQTKPYPEKEEIHCLAQELGLLSSQVEEWFHDYRARDGIPQQKGMKRRKAFRHSTENVAILKQWIQDNKQDPNPKGKELEKLVEKTSLTSTQVKRWCYNFRRKYKSVTLPLA